MAYLTNTDNGDSDSDELPAVNTVLQGSDSAPNVKSIRAFRSGNNEVAQDIKTKICENRPRVNSGITKTESNGNKGMKKKCGFEVDKRVGEDVHVGTPNDKKARRLRLVILDDSDEQNNVEPKEENDERDVEVPVLPTENFTVSGDERRMQRRKMIKKWSNTSKIAYDDQIWNSFLVSRYSDSDAETDLEGKGDLEARFANIRLLRDRRNSNKICSGERHCLSSKALGLEPTIGQRGRPVTPERKPSIQGHQDPNEPSEAGSRPKSRLISPTKRNQQQQQQQQQQRNPRATSVLEHYESGDTFWRQSFVNEWNDFYSPEKRTLSTKVFVSDKQHGTVKLPELKSMNQENSSSIIKPDKEAARQKKHFRVKKNTMAEIFLAELDQEVTGGRIAELASSTGGVKIVWSKKLVSTAGRAHWKRIKPKVENNCGDVSKLEQHYASIELADKVIDDDNRLKNVIEHEFCHLANFMISGVKDNPHGKSFKEWARKCSNKFAHYGVEVTTRHSYEIEYKYIWQCLSCNMLFKRHSKSINPQKQACGSCTSKLVQIKPRPRNGNQTDYQIFIKSHFQAVKLENPKASHASIMRILSSRYKGERETSASPNSGPISLEMLNGKLQSLTV